MLSPGLYEQVINKDLSDKIDDSAIYYILNIFTVLVKYVLKELIRMINSPTLYLWILMALSIYWKSKSRMFN